ncbi:GD15200 [Drosophila simulans]|uniref:GD15200 n=1 Tax=Drosophila simulans TaxID=7240 RepID=B4NSP5_DROSI|nr:GD15200 [Drosophila simulans]
MDPAAIPPDSSAAGLQVAHLGAAHLQVPLHCTEIEYTMQTVKKSSWGVKNNEEVASSETATSQLPLGSDPTQGAHATGCGLQLRGLISFGGVLALFVGVSVMGLVEMVHVLVHNLLLDVFTLLRMVWVRLRRFWRRDDHKREANQHDHAHAHARLHDFNERLSLAATAELPPFDYVN